MSCPGAARSCFVLLQGKVCICVAHHFLSLVNRGLCYMSSLIAGHCTLVQSRVHRGHVGKADIVQGKSSREKQNSRVELRYRKRSISFVWAATATTNTRVIFLLANLVKPALHEPNATLKKNFCLFPCCRSQHPIWNVELDGLKSTPGKRDWSTRVTQDKTE